MSNTNPFAEDAADARHSMGAMDRHAEIGRLHKNLTEWAEAVNAAPPSTTAPSPFLSPVPADVMRASIKMALNDLLHIDLVNDETDDVAAKLRGIAAGLIEVL